MRLASPHHPLPARPFVGLPASEISTSAAISAAASATKKGTLKMGFSLRRFLPKANRAEIDVPRNAEPEDGVWFMEWRRRATVQTGGQNYSLSSQQLPMYSLSGPAFTNAKRINPLEPAPAVARRQIPTVTVTGADILNGTIFGQPLFDPETGGFTAALIPQNARPYNINGVRPAGVA
jgi:hypothetical protein